MLFLLSIIFRFAFQPRRPRPDLATRDIQPDVSFSDASLRFICAILVTKPAQPLVFIWCAESARDYNTFHFRFIPNTRS